MSTVKRKILFISPAKTIPVNEEGELVYKPRANVSLPALTVLGVLEQRGWETSFIDAAAEGYRDLSLLGGHLVRFGLSDEAVAERAVSLKPSLILATSMFTFEEQVVKSLCKVLKERLPKTPIIVGGIHATTRPDWILEDQSIDCVVLGEVENVIEDILLGLLGESNEASWQQHIAYKQGAYLKIGLPARLTGSPDFPWAFRTVLIGPDGKLRYTDDTMCRSNIYGHRLQQQGRTGSFSLYGSRGCPTGCEYCASTSLFGPKIRHMGSERMFKDFIALRRQLGIHVFYNQADTFGYHKEDIQFLRLVADYRSNSSDFGFVLNNPNAFFLRLFFPTRLKGEFDWEFVDLLARAGINVITLAIETFTQRFNRKIDWSRIKLEKVVELLRYLREKDIKSEIYLIYAFPGQTYEELVHDLTCAGQIAAYADKVCWKNLVIFPGTEYYNWALREQRFTEDEYRQEVQKGYSFHRLTDFFNFSKIPTSELKAIFKKWSPAFHPGLPAARTLSRKEPRGVDFYSS